MEENWPPPESFSSPYYSSVSFHFTSVPHQQLQTIAQQQRYPSRSLRWALPGLAKVIRNTEAQVLERARGMGSRPTNTAMFTRQNMSPSLPLTVPAPVYLVTCSFVCMGSSSHHHLLLSTLFIHLSPALDRKGVKHRDYVLLKFTSLEPSSVPSIIYSVC